MIRSVVALFLSLPGFAMAQQTFPFNFQQVELSEIVNQYSKQTGQQFIYDANFRGVGSLINPKPVTREEAFNQLADVLALNGFTWVPKDNVIMIQQARKALRNNIDVVTELPPLRPQKMITWVYQFKHIPAEQVYRELRVLQSNEGELNTTDSNKLVLSDWVSNLHRVAKIFEQLDKPENAATKKLVQDHRNQRKLEMAKDKLKGRVSELLEDTPAATPRQDPRHPKGPPAQTPPASN